MVTKHLAIVLSTIKYRDNSLIVKFFTKENGLETVMCNGIRKSKNGKMGLFQPLALCEIVVSKKPHQNMGTLKEIKNTPPLAYLHNTPSVAPICFYLSGLVAQFIHEDNADEKLFDFVWDYALLLDQKKLAMTNIPIHFTCNTLKLAGYLPYPDFNSKNNNAQMADEDQLNAGVIQACVEHNAELICETKIDAAVRKNCLDYLIKSAAKVLHNNKINEVYEQIKILYN